MGNTGETAAERLAWVNGRNDFLSKSGCVGGHNNKYEGVNEKLAMFYDEGYFYSQNVLQKQPSPPKEYKVDFTDDYIKIHLR